MNEAGAVSVAATLLRWDSLGAASQRCCVTVWQRPEGASRDEHQCDMGIIISAWCPLTERSHYY